MSVELQALNSGQRGAGGGAGVWVLTEELRPCLGDDWLSQKQPLTWWSHTANACVCQKPMCPALP